MNDSLVLSTEGWETPRRRACAAILARVRKRIENPGAHARGAFARNASGEDVGPRDPSAVAWCFNGALYAEALGSLESHLDAFVAVQEQIDPHEAPATTVSEVNDGSHGHRRILAYIDGAITRLGRS